MMSGSFITYYISISYFMNTHYMYSITSSLYTHNEIWDWNIVNNRKSRVHDNLCDYSELEFPKPSTHFTSVKIVWKLYIAIIKNLAINYHINLWTPQVTNPKYNSSVANFTMKNNIWLTRNLFTFLQERELGDMNKQLKIKISLEMSSVT